MRSFAYQGVRDAGLSFAKIRFYGDLRTHSIKQQAPLKSGLAWAPALEAQSKTIAAIVNAVLILDFMVPHLSS